MPPAPGGCPGLPSKFNLERLGWMKTCSTGLFQFSQVHFRPPLDDIARWKELHGARPTAIVMGLNRIPPPRYVAAPRVHLAALTEIHVSDDDHDAPASCAPASGGGGVATATWMPPRPTSDVVTELPDQDAYFIPAPPER